ncbi:MAG TPA: hypothetical protein VGO61_07230 [Steroidobacteraceae bacterium]|jgi:hypothetical protein|nr:hypothetical protein [Steroidobacteraceae bacterium]
MNTERTPKLGYAGPAWTLVLLAPLIAEVLPGATRISSIFVFPIEVAIWGGGTLLIREAVRQWNLGWLNMLLLAFALSIAEEFLIQQTSVAPMVLQILPGEPFARAWGINYVYFLWALFYESVLVVIMPIMLCELIFRSRRADPWLKKWSNWMVGIILVVACFPAWYSWTQIARTKIFHVPEYNPPLTHVVLGAAAIALLIFAAIGPARRALSRQGSSFTPPNPWLLGIGGVIAAVIWYGMCLLGFGIRPTFPPAIAVAVGLGLALLAIYLLPRYSAHPSWSDRHRLGLVLGTVIGSMAVSFAGFIDGASKLDLYGKIILNVIATVLLIWLALRSGARPASDASTSRAA